MNYHHVTYEEIIAGKMGLEMADLFHTAFGAMRGGAEISDIESDTAPTGAPAVQYARGCKKPCNPFDTAKQALVEIYSQIRVQDPAHIFWRERPSWTESEDNVVVRARCAIMSEKEFAEIVFTEHTAPNEQIAVNLLNQECKASATGAMLYRCDNGGLVAGAWVSTPDGVKRASGIKTTSASADATWTRYPALIHAYRVITSARQSQ